MEPSLAKVLNEKKNEVTFSLFLLKCFSLYLSVFSLFFFLSLSLSFYDLLRLYSQPIL